MISTTRADSEIHVGGLELSARPRRLRYVRWRGVEAVLVAIAAAVAAVPVAGFVGLAVAAAVDHDVRVGRDVSVADGLVSAAMSLALLAPVVIGLGVAACALLGVRSRLVKFGAPPALIVALGLPATLLVIGGAPDPSPIDRRNLPLLQQIAPPPGATSDPAMTFNNSGEWESISWVTRRFDQLAPQATVSATRRHYITAMQAAGWHPRPSDSEDPTRTFMTGRRYGRQLTIELPHDTTERVQLSLH